MPRLPLLCCLLLLPSAAAAASPSLFPDRMLDKIGPLLADQPAPPRVTEAQVMELEQDDPETYVFVRGAMAHPPAPEHLGGDGQLHLVRAATGESARVRYRRADGAYDEAAVKKLDRLMRCSLTAKEAPMSLKLLEILDAVEDKFGGRGLLLLSGYRTPVLNRQVPGSARRSLHMLGWAADIQVPGVPTARVAAYARKLDAGGVGYYAQADFLHLDAGRARGWSGKKTAPRPRTGQP